MHLDDRDEQSTIAQAIAHPPAPEQDEKLTGAWDHFYNHCLAIIGRSPAVRRLSQSDREDCVQEVMFELVRRFGEKTPEEMQQDLMGWITVVSRNKATDILRRRSRRPVDSFDDGSGAALPADEDPAAAAAERRGEAVSLVWEALVNLDNEVPVTSYLVFFLRTIEDWDIPEIAELFRITPEQARARCHRVKKKFEALLKVCSAQREHGEHV